MSLSARLLMIPDWQALVLILSVTVTLALLGFLAVHRLVPVSVRRAHNDVAGFIFAAVGVMYGVLLAFVVVVVWEQYHQTRENFQKEASSAVSFYHAMGAYAEATHAQDLRPALASYLGTIVEEEFPAMAAMQRQGVTSQALQALWVGVRGMTPSSAQEQILYGELLSRLNDLDRLRVSRLDDAREELPGVLWLALIAGAIFTIGFAFLLGTENVRAHGIMIGLLAGLIGVVFYVTIELDHPFMGTVSIGEESLHQVLEMTAER